MALFPKKIDEAEPDKTEMRKNFLSPYETFLAAVFGICLSSLLYFSFTAGRFYSYKIPLSLIEMQPVSVFWTACLLFLAATTAAFLQRTYLTPNKSNIRSSRAMSCDYFFSLLAAMTLAIYSCCVVILYVRMKIVPTEVFFILFLFCCGMLPRLTARTSPVAHTFTAAASVIVITLTGFCIGLAVGKIEPKKAATVNGEQFVLAVSQDGTRILAGYDFYSQKANGRVMILPQTSPVFENTIFIPLVRKYK